jgi:large subunit ribosomal protein L10
MSNRDAKAAVVEEVAQALKTSQTAIVADYRGLTVAQITELRRQLRAAGIEFKVVKNTLARRATAQTGMQELDAFLVGPTAVAFGKEDVVAPAKILNTFAVAHKALELKGGVVEGRAVTAEGIKELATLPSRDGLLAMLLSVLQAPMRNLAYTIQQVADQQGEAGA